MSWPNPPLTNGQQTTINGVIYQYDSATTVWNRIGTTILSTPSYVSTVSSNAQPNITSVGTLSGLTLSSNSNISMSGSLSQISGVNTLSGTYLTGTLTTQSQPNITSVGTLTSLNVTGNVSSGTNIIGNGQYLTSLTGGNVTGQVSNSLISGTVYTNAQPNITSVGTLQSTTIAANSNITMSGSLSQITGANTISGTYLTGTLTTGSQPNITSHGTLTGLNVIGNISVTGNINATGNLNYQNVTNLEVGDALIYIGANNTGNLYDLGIVASYNDTSYKHTGLARNHNDGYWTFFDGVVAEPSTTIDWANATYPTLKVGSIVATTSASLGNSVTSNYYTGTLTTGNQPNITSVGTLQSVTHSANSNITLSGSLSQITGANTISGTYLTGTLTTGSQPNITSTGTLQSTTFAANSNITMSGGLSQISGANLISGTYLTGTLTTNAQPNITSTGTLSGLVVGGNLTTQQSQEVFQTKTGATGTVVHDFSLGGTFFHTSISANFTANFTNIPSTSLRSTVAVLVLNQGVTPYYCNAVTINGSAQTIKWLNAVTPTPTASRTEFEVFTFFNNAGTYTVTGSLVSYG